VIAGDPHGLEEHPGLQVIHKSDSREPTRPLGPTPQTPIEPSLRVKRLFESFFGPSAAWVALYGDRAGVVTDGSGFEGSAFLTSPAGGSSPATAARGYMSSAASTTQKQGQQSVERPIPYP
jgi:hypothetical protein